MITKEELKTLKNLEFVETIGDVGRQRLVFAEHLRHEAVKWVQNCKYCRSLKTSEIKQRYEYCPPCLRFIRFFNLSEEDLK